LAGKCTAGKLDRHRSQDRRWPRSLARHIGGSQRDFLVHQTRMREVSRESARKLSTASGFGCGRDRKPRRNKLNRPSRLRSAHRRRRRRRRCLVKSWDLAACLLSAGSRLWACDRSIHRHTHTRHPNWHTHTHTQSVKARSRRSSNKYTFRPTEQSLGRLCVAD